MKIRRLDISLKTKSFLLMIPTNLIKNKLKLICPSNERVGHKKYVCFIFKDYLYNNLFNWKRSFKLHSYSVGND